MSNDTETDRPTDPLGDVIPEWADRTFEDCDQCGAQVETTIGWNERTIYVKIEPENHDDGVNGLFCSPSCAAEWLRDHDTHGEVTDE